MMQQQERTVEGISKHKKASADSDVKEKMRKPQTSRGVSTVTLEIIWTLKSHLMISEVIVKDAI